MQPRPTHLQSNLLLETTPWQSPLFGPSTQAPKNSRVRSPPVTRPPSLLSVKQYLAQYVNPDGSKPDTVIAYSIRQVCILHLIPAILMSPHFTERPFFHRRSEGLQHKQRHSCICCRELQLISVHITVGCNLNTSHNFTEVLPCSRLIDNLNHELC